MGVLWGDAGVGKTTAIRQLTGELPRPDYQVLYLCNTSGSPLDLYRSLAGELGVRSSHRRGQLWTDIKRALVHMVDERGTAPVVVLDEAQLLSDAFLADLAGFLEGEQPRALAQLQQKIDALEAYAQLTAPPPSA